MERRATARPAACFDEDRPGSAPEDEKPSHATNFGFEIYNEIIIFDPV